MSEDNKLFTIPNIITFSRMMLIPVFGYLLFQNNDYIAFTVLFIIAATDFLDGKLARMLGQTSKLGEILDPLVDRLFMFIVPLLLVLTSKIFWLFVVLIYLRDVIMFFLVLTLKSKAKVILPVIYLGKIATALLMLGIVFSVLDNVPNDFGHFLKIFCFVTLIWGIIFYYYSAVIYWWQGIKILKSK